MNGFFQDGRGIFLGDFLDFHAAGAAGHKDDASGFAIDQQAEVEFALDVQAFFDEQALDDAASGAGLNGDQIHAQHAGGDFGGFVGRMGQLDATGFAASAGMNLRLDDDNIGLEAV